MGRARSSHRQAETRAGLVRTRWGRRSPMGTQSWVKTAAGGAGTGGAGTVATDTSSPWYRQLRKPRWQPPGAAFPIVWTPLYALIAVAGARVLQRSSGAQRAGFARAYALNLVLNAGWTAVFFRARKPALALAEIAALDASNLVLMRRAARVDRIAGV